MPENSVSVSDILRASVCPMQLYLAKSSPAYFLEPLRYSVAKQLSYHLGEELNREEIREGLKLTIKDCGEEAFAVLDEMIEACSKVMWRQALTYDMQVDSGKYNIHRRVDRVFDDSFSIVKGGKAPTHGVYASDRL
ncbi:MAG TPA: hypothetical protein O0X94_05005, partial [Methanocorpusculum sp.]|nr:hypothetical protein [Methanocorpusculum sp.]